MISENVDLVKRGIKERGFFRENTRVCKLALPARGGLYNGLGTLLLD